ncbi:MAG: acyltransferase family protein [Jatrophihabitantaceae bacterium]
MSSGHGTAAPAAGSVADTGRGRAPGAPDRRGFRPDIQGLRAIAVSAVVIYHLFPSLLPGGFVGVDVFFVISGYLITGHLAKSAGPSGRVPLLDFWGRRARRLLPAAALVLSVTWAMSRLVLPLTRLPAAADQVRASALYMQNWTLARNAVDYLNASDAPSPVEHFWSLSVEEQFYLFWPLLFVLAWLVTRRFRAVRRPGARAVAVGLLVLGVIGASLYYSAAETHANPAAAYFITTTRVWELGLGGALALLPARVVRRLARQGWASWVGLGMVALSLFVITRASAFPGTIALLPTLGTGLLLVCGSSAGRVGTAPLTSLAPAVFVGNLSYSLYLWHWPVIVLWEDYTGRQSLDVVQGLAVAGVSVVLAWLTRRYVEDRVRLAPAIAAHRGRSLAMAMTLLIPVGLVALSMPSQASSGGLNAQHPGALALADHISTLPQVPYVPSVTAAPDDAAPFEPCEVVNQDSQSIHCRLGDTTNPRLTVALVGDSVVGQWQTALNQIAKRNHWLLITDYRASCEWSATMTAVLNSNQPYTACYDWGKNALHDLLTNIHPDVVITSGRPTFGTPSHPKPDHKSFAAIARGTATYWRELIAAGTKIVALKETPEMGINVPDCLSSVHGSVASCTVPRKTADIANTPIERTVKLVGKGAELINMNSLICTPTRCPPVVGNVVVYLDTHHMTQTYTRTVVPYLSRALLATSALGPPQQR